MKEIRLSNYVGSFAENKDIAQDLRLNQITKEIEAGNQVTLNFEGIDSTTQSFIHALISDLIRKYGSDVLDKILFKNCTKTVQKIINIVITYTQEAVA